MSDIWQRLAQSPFRSRFRLTEKDKQYILSKGIDAIKEHAEDFISKRLAPAHIINDGKQTPMRGHPVFVGQHATGTCCRGCLEKWHNIAAGSELNAEQQEYVVSIIMSWIKRQIPELANINHEPTSAETKTPKIQNKPKLKKPKSKNSKSVEQVAQLELDI